MPEPKAEVPKTPMFPNPANPGEMITKEEFDRIMKEQRDNPEGWREKQ